MIEFENPVSDELDVGSINYEEDEKEFNKCINFIGKVCLFFVCADFIAIGIVIIIHKDEIFKE